MRDDRANADNLLDALMEMTARAHTAEAYLSEVRLILDLEHEAAYDLRNDILAALPVLTDSAQ